MYLFLDTEFTDFRTCDLISLGLVSEDGEHEYYVEISDYKVEWQSDFVRDVVVPLLDKSNVQTHVEAGKSLAIFLNNLPTKNPVLVADYSADFNLIVKLLYATSINRHISTAMVTKAFLHACHERGFHSNEALTKGFRELVTGADEYFVAVDKRQHHALVDARAARYAWIRAMEVMKNEG